MDTKVLIVGESNVGKTSLVKQYVENIFSEEKTSTIGYDTVQKLIEINNKIIKLLIWDTCGQEHYRTINNMFLKNSKIVILVYDITNIKSFNELKNYWYPYIKDNLGNGIVLGIAGNKSDLYEKEEVNEEDAREFSNSIDAIFNLTTAKNNEAINNLFKELVVKYIGIGNYEKDQNERNSITLKAFHNKKTDKKGCCKKN